MSRQHHELKCETEYFQDVERGKKKFELRLNDRNFKVHDTVSLHETVNGVFTKRIIPNLEIRYILTNTPEYGLMPGYCIFCW
jgi:ASC-1-like (ASCH) protein